MKIGLGRGGLVKRGLREGVRVMKWRAIAIRVLDHPTVYLKSTYSMCELRFSLGVEEAILEHPLLMRICGASLMRDGGK